MTPKEAICLEVDYRTHRSPRFVLKVYQLGTITKKTAQYTAVYPAWQYLTTLTDSYDWGGAKALAEYYCEKTGRIRLYRTGKHANLDSLRSALNLSHDTPHWVVLEMLKEWKEEVTSIYGTGKMPK